MKNRLRLIRNAPFAAVLLASVFLKPGVALADGGSAPSCSDTYETVTLRAVSVSIDGVDTPEHPAIGSEEFSIRARQNGGIKASLADPITGESQAFSLDRLEQ